MGLSGSKTKTKTDQTNRPVFESQIKGAHGQLSDTYNQQAPKVAAFSDKLLGVGGDLLERYQQGDPAINAARGYVTDTLSGDPAQNPYLDDIIRQTNDSVRNQIQAQMGTRGQTGGSDYYGLIGRQLAQNESGLRYSDYDRSMDRRAQAAGMAPGVVAGDLLSLQPALQAGQMGSMMPMNAAAQYAAGTGGLLGQYQNINGTQTTKSSPGLMGILGMGLQGASLFSDERLKEDIREVGITDGGLTLYSFKYKSGGPTQVGVMAQEVAEKQPDALGPEIGGFMTVDYGRIR